MRFQECCRIEDHQAGAMGKLGTVGLAAAIFSPWMNVSGSILANYWKKRLPKGEATAEPQSKS